MMRTTLKFPHFLPAMISRAAAAASSTRKAASMIIAGAQPKQADELTAMRPITPNGERPALQWKPSGPVRRRGQKKPGNNGRDVAEQHFMNVPVARRKGRGKRE